MLLRSTLIYAPAILLPRISAVLLLIVTTRLVDETEYGLLTLVVTIGEMTDFALSNWLRIALIRLGGSGAVTRGTLVRGAIVLGVTTGLAILIAIGASLTMVFERWQDFALAVSLYIVTGSISRFGLTTLQMQQRRALYTLFEGLRALLAIAFPVLALLFVERTFLAASMGTSLATLLAGMLTVIVAMHHAVTGQARFRYRALFTLGAPLIVLAVLSFSLEGIERFFLKIFWDAGAVALYAAAYSLARQPIDVLSNAVNAGGYPELIRLFDAEGEKAAGRFIAAQMTLMARLIFPAAAFLTALSNNLVLLILPSGYADTANAIFPAIVLGVVCMNFKTFVFDNVFHAFKQNWFQSLSFLPGVLGAVILGFVIVPAMGPLGAAYAFCCGSAVSLLASIIFSRHLICLPVSFAEMGQALLVALGTGLAVLSTDMVLGDSSEIVFSLIAAMAAGGISFLVLTALCNPKQTRALLTLLRRAG